MTNHVWRSSVTPCLWMIIPASAERSRKRLSTLSTFPRSVVSPHFSSISMSIFHVQCCPTSIPFLIPLSYSGPDHPHFCPVLILCSLSLFSLFPILPPPSPPFPPSLPPSLPLSLPPPSSFPPLPSSLSCCLMPTHATSVTYTWQHLTGCCCCFFFFFFPHGVALPHLPVTSLMKPDIG